MTGPDPDLVHGELRRCPVCQSPNVDVGATGLHRCNDCDKLFRDPPPPLRPLPDDYVPGETVLPFDMLRDTGVLWLINKAVFHPRGFALALTYEDRGNPQPENIIGWKIIWNGTEPGAMGDSIDEDALFDAVEALLERNRAIP